jgi:hypothetical protein
MMTLPLARAHERQETAEPEIAEPETAKPEPAKRRRRRSAFARTSLGWTPFAWDGAFADPVAIESDYHRMQRRQQERSGGRTR